MALGVWFLGNCSVCSILAAPLLLRGLHGLLLHGLFTIDWRFNSSYPSIIASARRHYTSASISLPCLSPCNFDRHKIGCTPVARLVVQTRHEFRSLQWKKTSRPTTTATFVAVVDPGTRNVIEDPQSYLIFIRHVSLPVDFRYFATHELIRT